MILWQNPFLLLLLTASLAVSLPSHRLQAQASFDQAWLLTKEEGLPDNHIHSLAYDRRGFLWIGTNNGLSRFDGTRAENYYHNPDYPYSLSDNRIYHLLLDPYEDKLWIGTRFGLNRFDLKQGTFQRLAYDPQDSSAMPNGWVKSIFVSSDSTLWVGSGDEGLSWYDRKKDRFFTQQFELTDRPFTADIRLKINAIYDIVEDPDDPDVLWLGSYYALIKYHISTQAYEVFPVPFDERNGLATIDVHLHQDGKLYVGTNRHGLVVFDPKTGQYQSFRVLHSTSQQSKETVSKLLSRSDQEIWITTSKGAALFHTGRQEVLERYYNDPTEKRHYGVHLIDPRGRIWARSWYGLHLYDPLHQQFSNYFYPSTDSNRLYIAQDIQEDIQDPNILYYAVRIGDGLYRFDRSDESWEVLPAPPAFLARDGSFRAHDLMYTREHQLIVVAEKGLLTLSPDKKRLIPFRFQPPVNNKTYLTSIIEDDYGKLWICSINTGLTRLDPETGDYKVFLDELRTDTDSLHYRWFFSPFKDKEGQIWFRARTGISILNPREESFRHFPYTPEDHPTMGGVWGITLDDQGAIWISGRSLARMDPSSPEKGIQGSVSVGEGTASSLLLEKDRSGFIWSIHDQGLVRLDPNTQEVEFFDESYGLIVTDPVLQTRAMHDPTLSLLSTGEMAVGYLRGLGIFHPDSLHSKQEVPQPYLRSFKVFDKPLGLDSAIWYKKHIDLTAKQNFFSMEFSSIGLSPTGSATYMYKMEGLDQDWVNAGKGTFVSYSSLPGGDYRFRLKALNAAGKESPEYQLSLFIATPWWKSIWFLGALTLLAIGLIYAIYRYRLYQVRRETQIKASFERRLADMEMAALRAQMNPHFIFNCLNSIDYYIWKNEPEKASDYLNSFSRLIRLILQNSRSEFVNLKDELDALRLYIQMESLRFEDQFEFDINLSEDINPSEIDLPPMLLQPYVENAIWHGMMPLEGKGKLDIEISRQEDHLVCVVRDNGIGREASAKLSSRNKTRKKSMGLQITKDRLNLINGLYHTDSSVEILDLKDASGKALGTQVNLKIPI